MRRKKDQGTRQGRLSEVEVQNLLDALEQSGLSRASFARKHGVGYSTLCSWLYRSRRRKPAAQWVEVTDALRKPRQAPSSAYRFHWPNGLALELNSEFESEKVSELLSIAQSSCSH